MEDLILNYYAFDFDDNILYMDTKIRLQGDRSNIVEVSTQFYADNVTNIGIKELEYEGNTVVDYLRKKDGTIDNDRIFFNFTDKNKGVFIKDITNALDNEDFAPSWGDFKECIMNGALFAIITARGHKSETIKEGILYINERAFSPNEKQKMYESLNKFSILFGYEGESDAYLLKKYINACYFIGIMSGELGNNVSTEEGKGIALNRFNTKVNMFAERIGHKAHIGFSDDSATNYNSIVDLIANLDHENFPAIIKYTVKLTNKKEIDKTTFLSTLSYIL